MFTGSIFQQSFQNILVRPKKTWRRFLKKRRIKTGYFFLTRQMLCSEKGQVFLMRTISMLTRKYLICSSGWKNMRDLLSWRPICATMLTKLFQEDCSASFNFRSLCLESAYGYGTMRSAVNV